MDTPQGRPPSPRTGQEPRLSYDRRPPPRSTHDPRAPHDPRPPHDSRPPHAAGTAAATSRPATTVQEDFPPIRRNTPFWLFWSGETISVIGTSVTGMLISLLAVVALEASPIWVGIINAATWLPWVVIGLPIGAWVDERLPRRVMIAADIGAALALATIPLTWFAGRLTVGHLTAVSFAVGTATVFFRAAYPKLVATLVRKDDLGRANSYLAGSESVAHVGGPPLGGILAAVMAPALAVVFDALSYVASAAFLWRLPECRHIAPSTSRETLRHRIATGWRFNFADDYLRYFSLQGALSNTGLTGFQTLLVLLLVRELGMSGAQAGFAVGVQGAGTVLGAVAAPMVVRRLGSSRGTLILFCGVGFGGCLLPLAARGWRTGLLLSGMFLIGMCVVCANVIRSAWRQSYVPMALMARTNTAAASVNFSLMPIAAVAAGWLADRAGLMTGVTVMGVIVAVVSFSCLFSPLRRCRDLPAEPPGHLLAGTVDKPHFWEDVR